MEKIRLGRHGPEVSRVGLGCMGMSDFYGTAATRDDEESMATIRAALDAGMTLLNTGDFYGSGRNELLIHQALKGVKERPLISVKFGALRTPQGGFLGFDVRPQAVKNFAAYSLNRLGVEAIDIYQPSRIDPSVPIEDTIGAIADLIKEGKVRYLGLSEASAENVRRAHAVHPVTALEIEYSLATRILERELLGLARALGIGIVAYGVLSRGLLSGALTGSYDPSDFRAHAPRFTGAHFSENQKKVAVLRSLSDEKGCTPAQMATAWVLHQGKDIVPLIGTTRRERLKENLMSLSVTLTQEDLRRLDNVFQDGAIHGERYASPQMAMVVH